jgi:hypothetical protein
MKIMSSDEFLIITSLDQPLDIDDKEILQKAENVIQEAIEQQNAYIALNVCRELVGVGKLSGMALAKILYSIKDSWESFDIDDWFEDVVYEYIGLHQTTVTRYVRVWEMYAEEKIPKKFEEKIQQRNIKEQIPIANAIAQGCEIDDDDWKELADAPDLSTVLRVVRDISGKPPRKSSLQIYLDRDGSLWAYQENQKGFVGSLEVDDKEELVKKAIERLVKNSGVMKR